MSSDQFHEGVDLAEKAPLVVVSACESAIEDFEKVVEEGGASSNGFTTIAGAFGTAGASTVIATLWEVEDASARKLITDFYQRMKGNNGSGLLAPFRDAQLELLRNTQYKHPFFWAGFVMMGSYR